MTPATGSPATAPQAITKSAAVAYTSDMAPASAALDANGNPVIPQGTRTVSPPKCFTMYGWVTPSRTLSCGAFVQDVKWIDITKGGVIVGTSVSFLWITKKMGNGGQITEDYAISVASATGVGLTSTATFNATGTGANRGVGRVSIPMTPGQTREGSVSYKDIVAKGEVKEGATGWGVDYTNTAPFTIPGTFDITRNAARCDNSVSGNIGAGCVNANVGPVLEYSTSDPAVNETAAHIAKAQASQLPKELHRETSATKISSNRTFSCSGVPNPRPTGKDCDEYPFASTKEGGNSKGGTRTHSGCGITQAVNSTGSGGVSRCLVDSADNQAAGRQLAAMYLRNRVLDGDAFTVKVVP